ncbi:SsrA-binding protein SmpB [Sporosarcina sp. ANT_H38]
MKEMAKGQGKVVAVNKKANHDFAIEETIEAGIVLQGTEIKSIRTSKVQLKDAFIRIRNNEAWITNMHISPYDHGNQFNHDPLRSRKLLLHKKQISKLIGQTKEQGSAIVPIKMYLKDGFAKVLIGVGKGKKDYDKRQDLKKKDAKREIDRALRDRQKY